MIVSRIRLTLRRLFLAITGKKGGSDKYRHTASATNEYKELLGGGSERWKERGAFQLHFLKEHGMQPGHRMLDLGCGPLRAGLHLIPYLDPTNYFGIDYNSQFIEIANKLVENDPELAARQPRIEVVDDFDFPHDFPTFDFIMVFSVLNHCTEDQKKAFFDHIDRMTTTGTTICISHAGWFLDAYLEDTHLVRTTTLEHKDMDLEKWGWSKANQKRMFPIIFLKRP